MFDSVRVQLTVWHVGVLSLVLVAFSVTVYVLAAHSMYRRLDDGLRSTLETVSATVRREGTAEAGTGVAIVPALRQLHFPHQAIAVFDAQGRLLYEERADDRLPIRLPPSAASAVSRNFYSLEETGPESDDSVRGVLDRMRTTRKGASDLVVINESLEPLADQLDSLQNILYVAVALALALAASGGWFLAQRSLAPVREFMTDAAHELRTPLSAMRTAASVALQREHREQAEYRDALTIIEQEARRLTCLVDDLFLLARADAGHPFLQSTEFYLDELLAQTVRAAAVLASRKRIRLEMLPLPEAPYRGDENLLRQMVWNLIDNAIKYTPEGGQIRFSLDSNATRHTLTITDTGIGIPAGAESRVFERFYRGDISRSAPVEASGKVGAGLGLPIARCVAQAHGGRLELLRSDETGSTFVAYLPIASHPS